MPFPQLPAIKIACLFALLSMLACSKKMMPSAGNASINAAGSAEVWLTDPANNILFKKQSGVVAFGTNTADANPVITVNDAQIYQPIDGFGYTLTGGSAYLIHKMNAASRAALLKELFAFDGTNIGTSYLRISIGASDLDDHVFSYDDLPAGSTDTHLEHFNLGPDTAALIPVLKEILAINPTIKILGSPWSPPTWMKSNDSTKGGHLKTEYYDVYAAYFIKYIQAMKAAGIAIDAITIQNEPLNPKNNPSLEMFADEQAAFIKKSLGPAFSKAGIKTKIILYDHNADRPDYPLSILSDADAAKYVDGSAFHLYGGPIDTLTNVHDAYPNKNVYFTEEWVGTPGNIAENLSWHINNIIIGSVLNWSRNALEWNLAADPTLNPHTPGGCTECLGAVTIDGNTITRNVAYYIVAHAAKFVRPGSVRIASNSTKPLTNAAFKTPGGNTVLIVINNNSAAQSFSISYKNKMLATTLTGGAVATYVW